MRHLPIGEWRIEQCPNLAERQRSRAWGKRNPKKAFFSFFSHLFSTFSDISQSDASIGAAASKYVCRWAACFLAGPLLNQQCVVYQFRQCNLCDTGSYVGYTRGHLHTRVDGHNITSSSVRKHYDQDHAGAIPEDLMSCFKAQ